MNKKKQASEDGKVKGILKRGDEKSEDDRFVCCSIDYEAALKFSGPI